MIRLTRRYRFAASHRLHTSALSDEVNDELYGKCNHPFGHGHDYALDVTVEGALDKATGRVCDLVTLDGLVTQYVLKDFDHKNLNEDAADFRLAVPTSENLAVAIEERLRKAWGSGF